MQQLKLIYDFSQARTTARMSKSDAASFLNITPREIERFETGEEVPTIQQLVSMQFMSSLMQAKETASEVLPLLNSTGVQTPNRKIELAQFFTPQSIANFMANMFDQPKGSVRLLDAGAGEGALSAAFVKRWAANCTISGDAHEIDEATLRQLKATLSDASLGSHAIGICKGDFIEFAAQQMGLVEYKTFSHAILNPPYKKISAQSQHRVLLRQAGLETVNLYAGFVAMAVALTRDKGEVVAIIPRSFCNGPYYIGFRKFILERCAIETIHIFERRDSAFSDDQVLQENVIIKLRVGSKAGSVKISESCDELFGDLKERFVDFDEIVHPDDRDLFIHVPLSKNVNSAINQKFNTPLSELKIKCSTGPVVDFRVKRHLSNEFRSTFVPLLYPQHFTGTKLEWPTLNPKKANAIEVCGATAKQLLPKGHYVVVRRFSSKEERWRINPGIVDPFVLVGNFIGIENHLNYFHVGKKPLDKQFCWGLSAYLSSTLVDVEFRKFSGHTQVNSTDLRKLPYPSREELMDMGQHFMEIGHIDRRQVDSYLECV
jgi:adenine-specific DNA-methyltransferase